MNIPVLATRIGAPALGAVILSASAVVAAPADVAPSADQVRPPLVGSTVPDVGVRSIEGESVQLADLVAGQPSILIFYRGGW